MPEKISSPFVFCVFPNARVSECFKFHFDSMMCRLKLNIQPQMCPRGNQTLKVCPGRISVASSGCAELLLCQHQPPQRGFWKRVHFSSSLSLIGHLIWRQVVHLQSLGLEEWYITARPNQVWCGSLVLWAAAHWSTTIFWRQIGRGDDVPLMIVSNVKLMYWWSKLASGIETVCDVERRGR